MATDNYRAAQISMKAIREGKRMSALEEGSASLMTMAEKERDRLRLEREQRKQGNRLGVANAIGAVAGIGVGLLTANPAAGAAVGGGVSMLGRRVAHGGWKSRVDKLTFASSRQALKENIRPDIVKDLAVSANNAASGYQAGNFSKAAGQALIDKQISEVTDPVTKNILGMARPEDVKRGLFGMRFDETNALQRYRDANMHLNIEEGMPYRNRKPEDMFRVRANILDIILGRK